MPIILDDPANGTVPHNYGRVVNRIVTRGMGRHINRMITQGYGGPPRAIVNVLGRPINVGGSGKKRRLDGYDEIIVWAKLVGINDYPPPVKIEGFIKVPVRHGAVRVMAEHVSSRVRQAWEDIRIIVKRLK